MKYGGKTREIKGEKREIKGHQDHTNKMDSDCFENYVWIYAHENDRKPRHSLVRHLIPLQLWQWKALFGDGLINSFWKHYDQWNFED